MTTDVAPDRQAKRRRRELIWIAGVIAYTILRFAIAWETLNRYGLNIWIFGILDVGTAVPYAIGTSRLVTSMVDKKLQVAAGWLAVAAISFVAPYFYIVIAGHNKSLPLAVWVVLALLVIALGANAALVINKRVRAARRLRRAES